MIAACGDEVSAQPRGEFVPDIGACSDRFVSGANMGHCSHGMKEMLTAIEKWQQHALDQHTAQILFAIEEGRNLTQAKLDAIPKLLAGSHGSKDLPQGQMQTSPPVKVRMAGPAPPLDAGPAAPRIDPGRQQTVAKSEPRGPPKSHLTNIFRAESSSALKLTGRLPEPGTHENEKAMLPARAPKSGVQQFVEGPFDTIMGVVIVLNAILLAAQLQVEGRDLGLQLGVETGVATSSGSREMLEVLNHSFNMIFLAELILRVVTLRVLYFTSASNLFDAAIILITTVDAYILTAFASNLTFARMFRLLRIARILRVVRTMKLFKTLRVLVHTVASSFLALFWSMVLLFIFMFMSSIFLCQSLTSYIKENKDKVDDGNVLWVYRKYGTSLRALYTMFEVTFSGGWPNYAWNLVEHVSYWYAVFYVIYVPGVVFAIIRIITALFLKETLQVAADDAETQVKEHAAQRAAITSKMKAIFEFLDESGDGNVTYQEFSAAIDRPDIRAYMAVIDLDVHQMESLFRLLDDGDGKISCEEFTMGVMRLKGHARSLDVVAIEHDVKRLERHILRMLDYFEKLLPEDPTLVGQGLISEDDDHDESIL
eukprot:TRINITY_DN8664_c0_g1_i1.p1 TRINITY_DN8664_c0_g1~~TRINITY_DN8664_c0_g1_i1.p1  ORF type:complete len:596 (-),score=97.56 TRINITY_DN8664_c0_g1_i1:90-1877(-)